MSAALHGASIRRTTRATRHGDWQTRAITTYHQAHGQATTRMQADLIVRIHRLTGRLLATESIFVERDACLATVVVDGTCFRLQQQDLIVLRPCAWCGIGYFESPAITSLAELGYALSVWQPLHPGCQPEDPLD
jgi:hypothetical protein